MSFNRVNAPGWASGDELTFAQINALDIDHANALDKSVAGDTLAGVVTVSGAGQINAANLAAITSTSAQGIESNAANGIAGMVAGGIQPNVASGILSNVDGGIASVTEGGIVAAAAGAIETTVDGGISLGGSAADWVTFGTTRTLTLIVPLLGAPVQTDWVSGAASLLGPFLQGTGNAGDQIIPIVRIFSGAQNGTPVNGATLTSAKLVFTVGQAHTGVPVNLPEFDIRRQMVGIFFGLPPASQSLFSTAPVVYTPTPGSGAAWYNSGNGLSILGVPDQNNVIDASQYVYWIRLRDEHGANALSGNSYYSMVLTFTAIANSAPG